VALILGFFMLWDLPSISKGVAGLRGSRLGPVYDEVAPVLGVFGKLFGKALEAQVRGGEGKQGGGGGQGGKRWGRGRRRGEGARDGGGAGGGGRGGDGGKQTGESKGLGWRQVARSVQDKEGGKGKGHKGSETVRQGAWMGVAVCACCRLL
jgi:hypothetical protein